MEKLILENYLSPGDIVMLTSAIRDIHRAYPDRFQTDVRTSCPALWENNPWLTPLSDDDPDVRRILCHYPLIQRSNQEPYHFIHGFSEYLSEQLDIRVRPTEFRGDIHLSSDEKSAPSVVEKHFGATKPYWIIAAGGKYDFTIKWWHKRRWQEVVNHFKDQVLFVQVGQDGHYHPPLQGVLDLRGKTSLRELIQVVYHADGIVCPVTLHMHLAAAVPLPQSRKRSRACVVVNGGREPTHWEAYPAHQFLHTIGALDCCATGGCWKSRTVALNDGAPLDRPEALCRDVAANGIPRCMDMITSRHVIDSMNHYLN